ncbi:MAG: hypothetical protein KDA66_20660, partial [Planctomycetaceae bacterium]|nr:hypothetical protein [Planctomycetaceae bacterium]
MAAANGAVQGAAQGTLTLDGTPIIPDSAAHGIVASIAPTSAMAGQGTGATYVVKLTNTGSETETFALSSVLPAGVTGAFESTLVTIPAGTSNFREITLVLTPNIGTAIGSYPFTVIASSTDSDSTNSATGEVQVVANGVNVELNTATLSALSESATTVSIAAASADKAEGNSGNTPFTFTVTRSGDVSTATTVDFTVTGSGNTPADAADFAGTLPSGQVSFAANETMQTLTVPVRGDAVVETDESFTVMLSNASGGATIITSTAIGTIRNDDVEAGFKLTCSSLRVGLNTCTVSGATPG